MARAVWKGARIAESGDFEVVEGNVYFPPDSIDRSLLRASETTSECGWKGTAHYYDVVVGGEVKRDAAWYYPEPKEAAAAIQNHVAFWRGIDVER